MRVARVQPFQDHFSQTARTYAAYRPSYPPAMVARLAQLAPARERAWDCGTGNGQAARLLAAHFASVIATDASRAQLAEAPPEPRIEYREAIAHESGLPDASIDLVTAAQALHWFDLERFFVEVERVLKPGGVFAAWSYARIAVDADVDRVLDWFYVERVGRYWPPERRLVETGYRELELPFEEIDCGTWAIEASLGRAALCAYVGTWSAVKECRAHEHRDPIVELDAELAPIWPAAHEARRASWPIALRAGRSTRRARK